jgi:hypothetical protein
VTVIDTTEKKLEQFYAGWAVHAGDLLPPAGRYVPERNDILKWEEIVAPITVFEAYQLGLREGKLYASVIGGAP